MRRNPGWFRVGYDPRRHCLTREERGRGGRRSALRQMQTIGNERGGGQQGGPTTVTKQEYLKLFLENEPRLRRSLYHRVPRADMEDFLQELFLHAESKLHQLQKAELYPWLRQIAWNKALRWNDKIKARRDNLLSRREMFMHRGEESPLFGLLRKETQDLVRKATRCLAPRQRYCVEMFYLEGMSYKEISRRSGRTLRSIAASLRMAWPTLKKLLTDLGVRDLYWEDK